MPFCLIGIGFPEQHIETSSPRLAVEGVATRTFSCELTCLKEALSHALYKQTSQMLEYIV